MSLPKPRGTLFLVPNLIAPGNPDEALPKRTLECIRGLRRFIVEGEKSAWRLLASLLEKEALAEVTMERLDEHTLPEALPALLAPALAGADLGLVSEAGVPCVADPGAPLVALAHEQGIRVVPLVGPSSILLALAASGLNGQRWSFLGYLPADREGRRAALRDLERASRGDGGTRIFIETPYRNDHLLEDCLSCLSPQTRLCLARALGTEEEEITSSSIASWNRENRPGKRPTVFLVNSAPIRQIAPDQLDRDRASGNSGARRRAIGQR